MTLQRHMFVNYDDTTLTIEIKAYETVDIYMLEPEDTPAETYVDTVTIPQYEQYVIFELHIPAETIYGFGVYSTPDYTNPDSEHLTILSMSGKDPWPQPPPPPPPYDRTGYAARCEDFLTGLSGERGERGARGAPKGSAKKSITLKPVTLKPTGTR